MQGQSSEFQAELPNVCSWRSVLSSCGHPLHCFPERDNRRDSVLQLCRGHRKSRQRPHAGSVSLACMTTVLFLP